eukprot:CAMPEP_0177600738 /NCGR_PEP_ID=MMETSP0419_2-20121207/13837_1 /TAXON_ID=582737 /ORGANISM="Tetraselmis sp., Strain GSL018" /LENGTH=154 /DNA_ID=CAMNT_0019093859 /DNA_START=21 /DNA_END=485 /DNA_ORIENTATION=+
MRTPAAAAAASGLQRQRPSLRLAGGTGQRREDVVHQRGGDPEGDVVVPEVVVHVRPLEPLHEPRQPPRVVHKVVRHVVADVARREARAVSKPDARLYEAQDERRQNRRDEQRGQRVHHQVALVHRELVVRAVVQEVEPDEAWALGLRVKQPPVD